MHEGAVEYFEPDWIIRVAPGQRVTCSHSRGSVRQPELELEIVRSDRSAWSLFQGHHYLSGELHPAAHCYVGLIGDQPATFTAVIAFPHATRPGWREHRMVCLPDYQGVGLGNAASAAVASLYVTTGRPYFSTRSHPAMVWHRRRSPVWKMLRPPSMVRSHTGSKRVRMGAAASTSRITAGFEYVGAGSSEGAVKLGAV